MSNSSSYPSTASLVSGASNASSQTLHPTSSSKDFSAAFGKLQSSLGLGGGRMPTSSPAPKKPSKLRSLFRPSAASDSHPSQPSSPPTAASSQKPKRPKNSPDRDDANAARYLYLATKT